MDPLSLIVIGAVAVVVVFDRVDDRRQERKQAEAQAQMVEAVGAAPAEALEQALAGEREARAALASALEQMPPAYCDGKSQHYDDILCAADRCLTRHGLTKDGGEATQCDRLVNSALSEHEIAIVESAPDEDGKKDRSAVFQRRK